MRLTLRDHREDGQQAIIVEDCVDFDRPLGLSVLRPVEHFHAKRHQRGINRIDLVFDPQLARPVAHEGTRKVVEKGEIEVPEQLPITVGVAVADRGLGWGARHAEVVQVASTATKAVGNVPQGLAFGDLKEQHRDQVRPRVEPFAGKVGLVLGDLLLEQISRKDADHLGENCNIAHERDDYFCGAKTR